MPDAGPADAVCSPGEVDLAGFGDDVVERKESKFLLVKSRGTKRSMIAV